jgi:DNA polymerase III delta subunit
MAAPKPEQELERLQQAVARGLPRVVIVGGESPYFRAEGFRRLLAAVPKEADLVEVEGDRETDGRELQDLRGGGLFARRRVLAVRRAEDWLQRHAAAIEATLPKLAPGCALLLDAAKLDGRLRLTKQLVEAGLRFEFRPQYPEELPDWLLRQARAQGLELLPDAARLLVEVVGKEPADLAAEIARLAGVLGRKSGRIGAEQLRGELTVGFGSDQFEFADALFARDRLRCERSLHALFARLLRGKDGRRIDEGGVIPMLASWLHRSIVETWRGRRLLDEGVPEREIPAKVGVPFFQERFLARVASWPRPDLRLLYLAVHDLQRSVRETGEEPELLLAGFLGRLFRSLPPAPRASAEARAPRAQPPGRRGAPRGRR